jgi:3D (Asp-Asp-Asp) domain-containing protein
MAEGKKAVIFLRRCVRASAALLLLLICTGVGVAYSLTGESATPKVRGEFISSFHPDEPSHFRDIPSPRADKRIVWMRVTAYCANKKCCGPHACGITASGKPVSFNGGKFVAADTGVLPFGTKVSIPGYHGGQPVPVIDRGGAIRGNRLDVFFPSYQTAVNWGVKWLPVEIEN